MSQVITNHQLMQGDGPVLARRYGVGITSVLRRCLVGEIAGLTGRTGSFAIEFSRLNKRQVK